MAFIHLIYFYIVLLSFLINPKEVMPRKGIRESDIPLSFATTSSSSPAISAVLLECPNVQKRAENSRPDCERQMMVHIRVSPSFQVETLDKFLLLDEVYDQRRKTRAKLMSPYLIEISRGEPVVMYPLQFAKSIRCDTCGHKNGNNTNTIQGNCEHPVDGSDGGLADVRLHLDVPGIHFSGEGVAPVSVSAGIHPSRSVQQEKKHKEQQEQHNANKAPMENGHNPAPAPALAAGPKPSEKIESRQKLAIGILDSSHLGEAKKQVNMEKGFSSRDSPRPVLRVYQDEGNMDYDADEYDELNLSDEALTGEEEVEEEEENGFSGQNILRDKRLKTTRPPSQSSLSSSKVSSDALLYRNEAELFREAERQGEEARMETIRAFTRKHVHQPVGGTVVGTSGPAAAAGDGYGTATARSMGNVGKPHVVGIQEDCIRPQGASDTDEIDDVESDVDRKAGSSGNARDGGQNAVSRLQLKSLLNKNEHQFGGAEMQPSQHHGAMQKSMTRLLGDKQNNRSPTTSKGAVHTQKEETSSSNREEENAFISPSAKSLPPGSHRSMQKKQQSRQQQQKLRLQKPHDDTKDVSTIRKFQFTDVEDSVDTQGLNASGSDDDGGASNEDYDRIDASVRDSTVIESKSNITSPDDIETVAGGMGDEFYWNTLHYPSSNVYSKHKALGASDDGFKITADDSTKFHESLDHKTPRILGNNVKTNDVARNGKKEFGVAAVKAPKARNYNAHQTASTSARRTPSKKHPNDKDEVAPLKHSQRNGSKARSGGKFSDKSAIARNRMKIRSSDVGGTGTDGSGGVVETSGMYTAKDGVVPAFPLNGYPGYLGVKTLSNYIPPQQHSESQYKLLENVPQEYLPHQPPYAKEISDPNLTVNDKISLLEVLSSHDNVKDAILRNLENELDSSVVIHDLSNHDRMPMPSTRLSRNREKKEIQKRSYLMYDDLTMRDTDEQYDDLDMKQPFDVPLFEKETVSNSGKCQSCKGNKCPSKRDGGGSCKCDRQGRHCDCSQQKTEKKIRSVSDVWYSVFNMSAPLQFLTTRVGIYRKRNGTWWKTAPSITLTSLSGIYASKNLSILFSSHVDIVQLRRPLTLQNRKLLIPRSDDARADDDVKVKHKNLYESINPNDVLAIDSSKFDFNKIHDDSDTNNKEDEQNNGASDSAAATAAKRALCHAAERQRKQRSSHSNGESDAVLSVGDLGYFPRNMNILEQCPSDPNRLCLNMLDEKAPAFTIKIKQPFLENALFYPGEYKVRIASVISDATTKGALQVAVILINEDFVSNEFTVCICNCPMTCGARTTVKKVLPPHFGETVSLLLPLEENKDTKFNCDVEVKSPDQKVISKRKFMVEPTTRCLCIWDCDCYCIQDLVSHDDYHVCHKLSDYEEQAAGFIEGGVPGQDLTGWWWFCRRMNHYAFSLVLCILFLGLLKAILGALCLQRIDRCGYDYVQPLRKYDYASRCRRFFINIVFFVVLPFICCCKCFTPSEEDLLMASTEWQCSLIQHDLYEDSSGDGDGGNGDGKWKKPSGLYYENGQNANDNNVDDDEETILRLSQNFESGKRGSELEGSQSRMTMSEYLLRTCEFDDGEEERDMDFVRRALTESQESIKMLSTPLADKTKTLNMNQGEPQIPETQRARQHCRHNLMKFYSFCRYLCRTPGLSSLSLSLFLLFLQLKSHCSEDLDMNNPLAARAEDLVQRLVAANIVYRTFEMPLHGVNVPPGQKYSIQGFFLPSVGPSYQFISTSPLLQQRQITTTSTKGNTSSLLEQPKFLREKDFQRTYSSKLNVLEAGDLSVAPPLDAPCINSSNTTNESQLTALLTSSSLAVPIQPSTSFNASSITALPPVDKFGPANDVVSEHGPATANETITRSDRVDDANNGSNLTAKQKDSPRGFE